MMSRAESLAIAGDLKSPDCEVLRATLATMLRIEEALAARAAPALEPVTAGNRKRGGR